MGRIDAARLLATAAVASTVTHHGSTRRTWTGSVAASAVRMRSVSASG